MKAAFVLLLLILPASFSKEIRRCYRIANRREGFICLDQAISTMKTHSMRVDERNGNWFAVESKSFEFTMEGKGKKAKCLITERSRCVISWIRFGIEGMEKLLLGVEECCRVCVPASRTFAWREDGRSFRLESKENNAGRFLLCPLLMGKEKNIGWFSRKEGGS